MKKNGTIILFCILTLAAACTPRGIIPKNKMAAINAEMFLLDQYAGADRQMRRFIDTCAVYKPLLRSFGYTQEQYLASVDYYLDNSRDMAKVLDMTEKILKKREETILKNIEKNARKADSTLVRKPRKMKEAEESAEDIEEQDR